MSDSRQLFDAVTSHESLIDRSRIYCEQVINVFDVSIDLDLVEWAVSTRAKRRAASISYPSISVATVGDQLDWDRLVKTDSIQGRETDLRRCELTLTWDAFTEYSASEWKDVLRHELVHIEQFQAYGKTDHGSEFKKRARELDASVHCRTFSPPKYLLVCSECEAIVGKRYRKSSVVCSPSNYRSRCCDAVLRSEPTDGSRE